MAIIYTYPQKASVDATDTFLITDGSDNQTKTVSASAIAEYVDDEVTLQEVLDVGNSAVQNMDLKGELKANEAIVGTLEINGDVQMDGSKFRKPSGNLDIFTDSGKLGIAGYQGIDISTTTGDLSIDSKNNELKLESNVEVNVTAPSTKLSADTLVLGEASGTNLVRITGGSGGSGYFPNSNTDEFSFNGVLALNEQVKDSLGATGVAGQALLVNGVNKTTWSTLYSQNIGENKILVGNASSIPTETNIIDIDLVTNDVIIGNASSLVTVKGGLLVPENGGPKTATSAGKPGEIAFDALNLYVCVSTDSWRRIPLQFIP